LNNELGVKGNVVLLSGSRSRQLLPPTVSSHGRDAMKKLCALPVR
jgi:hypothetical protein